MDKNAGFSPYLNKVHTWGRLWSLGALLVLLGVPTAICAHLAGYSQWDEARELLAGRDIYVDTSSSLEALEPERAADIIRAFGAQNVLFGTDFPLETPTRALARFARLPLTAEEKRRILGENVARVILKKEETGNGETDLV